MKLRNIFIAVLSALLVTVACTQKYEIKSLEEIQVSATFVSVPEKGGETSFDLTAAEDWKFVSKKAVKNDNGNVTHYEYKDVSLPKWLSVDPISGTAGTYKITMTAEGAPTGREYALIVKTANAEQNIVLRQGEIIPTEATCAEAYAAPDGKTFILRGVCTKLENTKYGNYTLKDDTGEMYVYGTLDNENQEGNFASMGIEEGDELKIKGPTASYNGTPQLKNVKVLEHKKSLLKTTTPKFDVAKDGGEVVAHFVVKGYDGIKYTIGDDAKSWVHIVGFGVIPSTDMDDPDVTTVKIAVDPNETMGDRTAIIPFRSKLTDKDGKVSETVVEITIYQLGPKTYDFAKATKVTSGKKYLMVAEGGAFTLLDGKSYGYCENTTVTPNSEGIYKLADMSLAWEFTSKDTGYTIKSESGPYIYLNGTYNSFNWNTNPTDGDVWTVTANADGSFKIMNVAKSKWIQYDTSYKSYGAYNSQKGTMPTLYEYIGE